MLSITPDNLPQLVEYLDEHVSGWQTKVTERLGGAYHRTTVNRVASGQRRNPLIVETMIALAEEYRVRKQEMEGRLRKVLEA